MNCDVPLSACYKTLGASRRTFTHTYVLNPLIAYFISHLAYIQTKAEVNQPLCVYVVHVHVCGCASWVRKDALRAAL